MADFKHNGATPEGFDVTNTGVKLAEAQKMRALMVITNASDAPIYLALKNSPTGVENQAEVGKGIYLAPQGGAYEINSTNSYQGEVWAIHDEGATLKRACVQRGS